MAVKETIGDGGGRKYANSQFSDQNRQDAISRVSAVQNSERARGESTDGLAAETHGHINSACCEEMTTTVTAAHHFMGGTCMTACTLHKSQKASSSLSRLTKKVT